MAAVFDLDLETEEGSEGEGEPEFSPAVSISCRARLDPGAQSRGAPYRMWVLTPLQTWIFPRFSPSPWTRSFLF